MEYNAKEITISLQKETLQILFNQEKYFLEMSDFSDELRSSDRNSREIARMYFNR